MGEGPWVATSLAEVCILAKRTFPPMFRPGSLFVSRRRQRLPHVTGLRSRPAATARQHRQRALSWETLRRRDRKELTQYPRSHYDLLPNIALQYSHCQNLIKSFASSYLLWLP